MAAVLAGAGVVHLLWASGSTWPAADADDLAELVVGRRVEAPEHHREGAPLRDGPMPGSAATLAVAGLLGVGAVLTAGAAGLVPLPGGRATQLARLGSGVASGVLLARGAGGLLVSSLDLVPTSARFRHWDLRLYSPLCLGLGVAGAVATSRG